MNRDQIAALAALASLGVGLGLTLWSLGREKADQAQIVGAARAAQAAALEASASAAAVAEAVAELRGDAGELVG